MLGYSGLTPPHAAAMGIALRGNSTIQILGLCGNPLIGDIGALALAKGLEHNCFSLRGIFLNGCHLGEIGGMAIAHALKYNWALNLFPMHKPDLGEA